MFDNIISPFTSTYTTLKATGDAVLGLPFLSFLLIPTMTSYSTSLNLLFFYLTWSTLVLSHDALRVEIVASLAVRLLFYVIPSAVFLSADVFLPGVTEGFKSLGTDALPLKNTRRKNVLRLFTIIGWSLFNLLLGVALQGFIEWLLTKQFGRHSALKVTTTLPLPWGMFKDLLKGLILRDLLTWFIHRYLLHSKANAIVRDLSQLHESWYHKSIKAPYPLSPSYDHPLVYVLRVFVPMYAPAMLFHFHALTFILYLAIVSLEDTFTHSGYAKLPTNFILGGIAHRNDMHCLTKGRGNFGTWGLVDWMAGTSIGSDATDDIVDEVNEADVPDKLGKTTSRNVAKVKKAVGRADVGGETSPRRRRTRRSRNTSDSE